MKALSIDIGASSGRCIVIEYKNGEFFKNETYRFLNGMVNIHDSLRWNIKHILKEVTNGIIESLKKYPDIETIGVDTWGCDYVLIDDKKEDIIELPYAYRDKRNIEASNKLLKKVDYFKIYSKTGIQFLPFNTIFQLYVDSLNKKEFDSFLMIPDVINFYLTGNKYLEVTNLSTTSLYNPKTKEIDLDLLKLIKVDPNKFPPIIQPFSKVGKLRKDLFKDFDVSNIDVVSGAHDTASAIASITLSSDSCYLSSGTWSLLGIELNEPLITIEGYKANFTNEVGLNNTIRYLKNIMGLFIIQELRKDLLKVDPLITFEKMNNLASEVNDNDIFIDIDDELFNTPDNMLNKFYEYLRKTNQETNLEIKNIIRIIYESMAFKYLIEFKKLKEITKKEINKIYVVGGGSNATLLNQLIANTLNIEVITLDSEGSALGNALAQFIYKGIFANLTEARNALNKSNYLKMKRYYPKDIDLYQDKFNKYLKIINRG